MTPLKPFQKEGVLAIRAFNGRALLGDEQGLGKTIQALDWIRRIPKHRPAIIICPSSVKYSWQAEAALHFNMRTEVLDGNAKGRQRALPGDIVILNYDILPSWLKILKAAKPQCVVFDECHYMVSRKAKRTKAALKLAQGVPSVVGLSGTPFTNGPLELFPILKAVRPDLFPNFTEFAWRYCGPRYTPWGWKYTGSSNEKELRSILRRECMIRRLKKDVLHELPAKIRSAVPMRLKSYVEYNEAQHEFLHWLRKKSAARADKAKKSQALLKVGYLLRLVAQLKLAQTIEWIEQFFETHPGEKLVGLTMHRAVIDALKEHFGNKAVIIDGRVTGKVRHQTVRQFQTNKRVPLLLGNWKAAGVGITLHAAAHGVALDLPWTPGALLQGEDRLHRIGQKHNVVIHYLVALNTIEEKQLKILRRKTKILDAILNGKATAEDLNIFEELLRGMKDA